MDSEEKTQKLPDKKEKEDTSLWLEKKLGNKTAAISYMALCAIAFAYIAVLSKWCTENGMGVA